MTDDRASKIRRFFKAVDIARKVLVLVNDVCEFLDEHALPGWPSIEEGS